MAPSTGEMILGRLGPVRASKQTGHKKTNAARRNALAITIENAPQYLHWVPEFGVVVCSDHKYAIGSVEQHLRIYHSGSDAEKKAVVQKFAVHILRDPKDVPLPPPLDRPFETLGKPRRAFICEEPECEWITVSGVEIRKHCNKKHDWKSSSQQRRYWHGVWVQTFFSRAGLQKYFTVDYDDHEGEERATEEQTSHEQRLAPQDSEDVSTIIAEWDRALDKQHKANENADAEIAKTDHTGWFSRTRWPDHLAGSNLRHLSRASRLPDRDETVLQRAVQVVNQVMDNAVGGLHTLDDESRRWLRSAKRSEPDVRPMGRLQNPESQATYTRYISRLLCYGLRVYQSVETRQGGENESESEDGRGSETESSAESQDGGESLHSGGGVNRNVVADTLHDAKRLFPWQNNVKEGLGHVWEAIEGGKSEEQQTRAVLAFIHQLIFRRVRGQIFDSTLMHFLAVLGINEETNRLRDGNEFSFVLAGMVYCVRVLGVEILLPAAERDRQTDDDDQRFREEREKFLADGSYSVMSKMLSLLAYGKHIALNHGNAGAVMWSGDGKEMTIRGMPIVVAQFRTMVHGVIEEAEEFLWRRLVWATDQERFQVPIHKLQDDVTWTKRGVSFINNSTNGLEDKREWMLSRALGVNAREQLRRRGQWMVRRVRAYLRAIDRFRELLLFSVHLTGGQPARGTEITSIRFRNGYLQDRNIFAIHGHMVVVTRYHKSQSQFDKPKVVPRFLPWRVGQLLAVYLVYVQPFQEYLRVQIGGEDWSDYVWANANGPWDTARLTKVITRETERRLGTRLTTHDYRHTAISIGRRVVGEGFAHGYAEEIADIEEAEVDTDDALEMSAGRGGEIGTNRYGVSVDVVKHLSSRTVDTFRPLSEKWHDFLQLSSQQLKARKRGREERSLSVTMEQDEVQPERKMALTLRNNGITGWATPMARYQAQLGVERSSVADGSAVGNVEAVQTQQAEKMMSAAVRRVLQCDEFAFRSEEQGTALRMILQGELRTALVIVLPTGGGKSLLFMAPACLVNPGVTIVVVPFRALIDNLVATAKRVGIDCIEWRPGEVNPAALVYVSADFVPFTSFGGYARLLQEKGLLRRVFVDECHLTFTSSDWRPKLAWLRSVRGLRCPTIMLTATLPVALEFELEMSMAAEMARYIRASTIRPRTRYIVQECKAGMVEEEAVALCRRMLKHLGARKGVVYSRSRAQCERIAEEVGCAYYHAGATDNAERLAIWLESGGLIVATSALGTGVDFPGVVFVLHVDLPYGMIDFAQESGRAGRGGEDVDSVMIIAEGRATTVQGQIRGMDDRVMAEFVTTKGCRRRVMSSYFDGIDVGCDDGEGEMARCDRCGEGLTALERAYRREGRERQLFDETLTELVDGCAACWIRSKQWRHAALGCEERKLAEVGLSEENCNRLRRKIVYEASSHSCHRCGISQRLCATGEDNSAKCQWPNVLVPVLCGITKAREGRVLLERAGFEGDERSDYCRWLGRRHPRRIWGEVVSNGTAVLIAAVVEMAESECKEKKGEEVELREEVSEKLRGWEGVCWICWTVKEAADVGHEWMNCEGEGLEEDEFRRGMVESAIRQGKEMGQQGGQGWQKWHNCRKENTGGCRECEWMGAVALTLVYIGPEEIREWIASNKGFEEDTKDGGDGMQALARFFEREIWVRGVKSSGIGEAIRRWG